MASSVTRMSISASTIRSIKENGPEVAQTVAISSFVLLCMSPCSLFKKSKITRVMGGAGTAAAVASALYARDLFQVCTNLKEKEEATAKEAMQRTLLARFCPSFTVNFLSDT